MKMSNVVAFNFIPQWTFGYEWDILGYHNLETDDATGI